MFASGIGESLYAPVIKISTPIEDDLVNAGRLSALGDDLPHGLGRSQVTTFANGLPHFFVDGRSRYQRDMPLIIDDLRVNVIEAAINC